MVWPNDSRKPTEQLWELTTTYILHKRTKTYMDAVSAHSLILLSCEIQSILQVIEAAACFHNFLRSRDKKENWLFVSWGTKENTKNEFCDCRVRRSSQCYSRDLDSHRMHNAYLVVFPPGEQRWTSCCSITRSPLSTKLAQVVNLNILKLFTRGISI